MEKRLTLYISIWGNLILGMLMKNKILVLIHIIAAIVLIIVYANNKKK